MVHATASSFSSKESFIPEGVTGMTELDRSKFNKDVCLPFIRVGPAILGKINRTPTWDLLRKYGLRKLGNYMMVMPDPDDKEQRCIMFNPSTMGEEERKLILDALKKHTEDELKFEERQTTVTYEDLDTRALFQAVLPGGVNFSGFTHTGPVIHCNIRDELMPYRFVIGQILLDKVRSCKTVVNKIDCIKSEYRNFELELLAGEPNYIVDVIEEKMVFRLDFSKVFWNSRLSNEHKRIVNLLDGRSLVYDACAGVGPFILPAAKKKKCRKLFANDLNPDSTAYLIENIDLNKIDPNNLEVFTMDAVQFIREIAADDILKEIEKCKDPTWTPPSGAHIVMNLPGYAVNFLPAFRGLLHGRFSEDELPFPITVYCYLFIKALGEPHSTFVEKAREVVLEKLGWDKAEISHIHHVRTVSNFKEMFCVQVKLPVDLLKAEPNESVEPPTKRGRLADDAEDD
ncbi:unnamed protein product, partial [Mesorhabditis spiculigera]